MRKLIDGLAIASFVLSLTTVGAIGFGYLALTNKTNQEKIKNYAIGQVQKLLTDQLSKSIPSLPDATGNVVPINSVPAIPKFYPAAGSIIGFQFAASLEVPETPGYRLPALNTFALITGPSGLGLRLIIGCRSILSAVTSGTVG